MSEAIAKAVMVAALGGIVGWTANALTLAGRVTAIEKSIERVEVQMARLIELRAEHVAER